MQMSQTLFEKIWKSHTVVQKNDGPTLLYVDRHLVHEVTSPQSLQDYARLAAKGALTLQLPQVNVEQTAP